MKREKSLNSVILHTDTHTYGCFYCFLAAGYFISKKKIASGEGWGRCVSLLEMSMCETFIILI